MRSKTTLVRHILENTVGLKILVIENEIGEQGIDHDILLQNSKEDIILLNNGCICCKGQQIKISITCSFKPYLIHIYIFLFSPVRNDLIKTFHMLFSDDKVENMIFLNYYQQIISITIMP